MFKFVVILCSALFICSMVSFKFSGCREAALGNAWGVSWLAILFVGCLLGGYKATGK